MTRKTNLDKAKLTWHALADGSVILLGPRSLYDAREIYGEFWQDENGRWCISCPDDPRLIEAKSGVRGDAVSGSACRQRIERLVRQRHPGVAISNDAARRAVQAKAKRK